MKGSTVTQSGAFSNPLIGISAMLPLSFSSYFFYTFRTAQDYFRIIFSECVVVFVMAGLLSRQLISNFAVVNVIDGCTDQ